MASTLELLAQKTDGAVGPGLRSGRFDTLKAAAWSAGSERTRDHSRESLVLSYLDRPFALSFVSRGGAVQPTSPRQLGSDLPPRRRVVVRGGAQLPSRIFGVDRARDGISRP